MKRCVAFVLCLLLLLPSATFAAVTTPENDIKIDEGVLNQYLIDSGYPLDIINSFDYDLRELLYNEGCKFVSMQTEVI